MSWRKILPNLFTLAALVCATLSLMHSANGEFLAASQMLMLCLVFDGLDGNVARLVRGQTKFGAELDTFVDITAYGIAPAMMIYNLVMKDFGFWGISLVCLTIVMGALRLARFRVGDPDRGNKGYTGLPITVNAGFVAMLVFATQSGVLHDDFISLSEGPFATFVWACSIAFLFLQVSNVHYGKPTKAPLFFISGIAVVMMLFSTLDIAVIAAIAIAGYGFFFGFITPFIPKHASHPVVPEEDEDEDEPVRIRHS
jgi:CDP-diacylglycerol--serine O-phosphatidyltransferase